MKIEKLTKSDFDEIYGRLELFWGDRSKTSIHHPIFLYEFGNTAFVMRDSSGVSAYLYGFLSQTLRSAYVHLIGVRPDARRQGLARKLYNHFISEVRSKGANQVKAMTQPDNFPSLQLHRSLGFSLIGEPGDNGVPVVRDYRGPGQHRVVFEMNIK